MDKRKLRGIDPKSFKTKLGKARGLAAALDDGFVDVDREELIGRRMILVAWQLRPGIDPAYESARIWAMVETDEVEEGARNVKFRDAGRGNMLVTGIPEMLRDLQDNGTTTDVAVTLRAERYEFTDRETGEDKEGVRYWFQDHEGNELPDGDDSPDF